MEHSGDDDIYEDVDVSERSMNGDEEEEQVMNDDEEVESVEEEEEEESERVDSVGECESDEENDSSSEDEEEDDEEGGGIIINGLHELGEIDWDSLTPDLVMEFKFPSLKVAFQFYNWYGRMNDFSGRKSRKVKNKDGEVIQQTFLCHREGYREGKYMNKQKKKRRSKPLTRCGCRARMKVHIDYRTRLWEITYFHDDHNHEMLDDISVGMLARHRKLNEDDILQIINMRKAGLGVPDIFNALATQCGGYHSRPFGKQGVYNELEKQRRMQGLDAKAALEYLNVIGKTDDAFFCSYTLDEDNRLRHLFWCDGLSQLDYQVFGDVLAFDATYKKNKYLYPVVVFSGVNHHNQSIVFAFAVVADETEETYVWLLEQFIHAMKGKEPNSVITDGDKAMKKAVERVFPNAHHRLCAWHLARNATCNIGKAKFTRQFQMCMLGDYTVAEFKERWRRIVTKFNVENHRWVIDIYERRQMWCSAYLRGKFFGGYRTTSRCEGLHSEILKFVHCRYNLVEFLQHLNRCLSRIRYRELEANYSSNFGEVVLSSMIPALESSAAKIFTTELFLVFRKKIKVGCGMQVRLCKESQVGTIFSVTKMGPGEKMWNVSYYQNTTEYKCSCQYMESYGIPCEHIVVVLKHLGIDELPKSLVLSRWTKQAKDGMQWANVLHGVTSESKLTVQYFSLLDFCRQMCNLACRNPELYKDARKKVRHMYQFYEYELKKDDSVDDGVSRFDHVKNPIPVRTKGCGRTSASSKGKSKRVMRCGLCRQVGHNRTTCQVGMRRSSETSSSCSSEGGEDEFDVESSQSFDQSRSYDRDEHYEHGQLYVDMDTSSVEGIGESSPMHYDSSPTDTS